MTHRTDAALVLVLEDDPGAAGALAALLSDWGYDCVHGDSLEAVAPVVAQRSTEVRAIISDFDLGGGATGIEAIAALSALGVVAPALILTGTLAGEARRQAAAAGCHFMEKPAAPKRLHAWLERMAGLGR